jgi:hypothetical protein
LIKQFISLSRVNKQLIMLLVDSVFFVSILLASFSIYMGHWYRLLESELSDVIDSFDHERLRKLLIQIVLGLKLQCEIHDILHKDKR